MRISTYNIWDSVAGMPYREEQIINEIKSLDSDIIVLQEVKSKDFSEKIASSTNYINHCFTPLEGEKRGLGVYSKYPIKYYKYTNYALIAVVEHMKNLILLVNVHLPDASILAQENCIVNINKEISTITSDYKFILGDFNCSETSSVHRYLQGQRSLNGTEVNRYWTDLASVAEEFLGIKKEMTLDLINNPRWKGKPQTDNSSRVDCIFINDCFPNPYPKLMDLKYFGKTVDERSGLCASDHYGVYVDIQMPYEEQ